MYDLHKKGPDKDKTSPQIDLSRYDMIPSILLCHSAPIFTTPLQKTRKKKKEFGYCRVTTVAFITLENPQFVFIPTSVCACLNSPYFVDDVEDFVGSHVASNAFPAGVHRVYPIGLSSMTRQVPSLLPGVPLTLVP